MSVGCDGVPQGVWTWVHVSAHDALSPANETCTPLPTVFHFFPGPAPSPRLPPPSPPSQVSLVEKAIFDVLNGYAPANTQFRDIEEEYVVDEATGLGAWKQVRGAGWGCGSRCSAGCLGRGALLAALPCDGWGMTGCGCDLAHGTCSGWGMLQTPSPLTPSPYGACTMLNCCLNTAHASPFCLTPGLQPPCPA